MMQLSTKGRYGVKILLDIAVFGGKKPRTISEIAASQGLSEKYISRLIVELRKANFISSTRGVNGGYTLSIYPKYITLLDIIEVMEGTISIIDCVMTPNVCGKQESCLPRNMWMDINDKIRSYLNEISLQYIIDNYDLTTPEGLAMVADPCEDLEIPLIINSIEKNKNKK